MKKHGLLILIIGVFSILNTEMGIVGILPAIAESYQVSISTAGLLVSLFALAVAVAGPTLPLIFSGVNRKTVMMLVLSIFLLCNVISAFSTSFPVLLIARVIPAFFHPVYVSLAFSVAAASVPTEDSPKAVSKVMIGVSAGMVLGVPISNYVASVVSLNSAMLVFALVNALALLATMLFIPSLPVQGKRSYGAQLGILRKNSVWISIIGVILLNGAVFGVYSYISEYLEKVTKLPSGWISLVLLAYGLANMVGNAVAGRLLSRAAHRFMVTFPFLLAGIYIVMVFAGHVSAVMTVLIGGWGILSGAGGNINQYWITSTAPEAPDFANGLFLTAANLGTTIGAGVSGFFIAGLGIRSILAQGLIFLVLAFASVLLSARLSGRGSDTWA